MSIGGGESTQNAWSANESDENEYIATARHVKWGKNMTAESDRGFEASVWQAGSPIYLLIFMVVFGLILYFVVGWKVL